MREGASRKSEKDHVGSGSKSYKSTTGRRRRRLRRCRSARWKIARCERKKEVVRGKKIPGRTDVTAVASNCSACRKNIKTRSERTNQPTCRGRRRRRRRRRRRWYACQNRARARRTPLSFSLSLPHFPTFAIPAPKRCHVAHSIPFREGHAHFFAFAVAFLLIHGIQAPIPFSHGGGGGATLIAGGALFVHNGGLFRKEEERPASESALGPFQLPRKRKEEGDIESSQSARPAVRLKSLFFSPSFPIAPSPMRMEEEREREEGAGYWTIPETCHRRRRRRRRRPLRSSFHLEPERRAKPPPFKTP